MISCVSASGAELRSLAGATARDVNQNALQEAGLAGTSGDEKPAPSAEDREFLKRAWSSVERARLSGVNKSVTYATVTALACVSLHFTGLDSQILAFVAGAAAAGPGAAAMNASLEWLMGPTVEQINVWSRRRTGGLKQRINSFYDRLGSNSEKAAEANESPRIANLLEDGINYADMPVEDQVANWQKCLRMWVAVQTRFGQLLRDVHHGGRVLMMIGWHDEQGAAQLVQTLDSKLLSLDMLSEQILTPYKTSFVVTGSTAKLNELEDSIVMLRAGVSAPPDVSNRLVATGLPPFEIQKLLAIEVERSKAIESIVTTLAVNELRSFMTAEANRNLNEEARQAQRAVRRGFNLQNYVEKYLEQVKAKQREMGFTNSAFPVRRLLCTGFTAKN